MSGGSTQPKLLFAAARTMGRDVLLGWPAHIGARVAMHEDVRYPISGSNNNPSNIIIVVIIVVVVIIPLAILMEITSESLNINSNHGGFRGKHARTPTSLSCRSMLSACFYGSCGHSSCSSYSHHYLLPLTSLLSAAMSPKPAPKP